MTAESAAIRYLYSLEGRGMKFGLRNIRRLLSDAGNPQRCFRSIHVAGTNGKGSTCAFLASIFTEAGYVTGLYTSPHLLRFQERIRINGVPVPDDALIRYILALQPAIEKTRATFFEATTCIALRYFADQGVEIAVLETGLGGRLDATNVVIPVLSVITNVSYDHTDLLGTTLSAIAREKGGIMKKGVPCIIGNCQTEVFDVFRRIAVRRKTPLFTVADLTGSRPHRGKANLLPGNQQGIQRFTPGLDGRHQRQNALLAMAAVRILQRRDPVMAARLTNRVIHRGLRSVSRNSGLRGRLERAGKQGRYLLDVAHNPGAVDALVSELKRRGARALTIVFGVMKDKDFPSMARTLGSIAAKVVTVRPRTPRALPEPQLREEFRRQGIPVRRGGTVRRGLKVALAHTEGKREILITGSHYVVGEALSALESQELS